MAAYSKSRLESIDWRVDFGLPTLSDVGTRVHDGLKSGLESNFSGIGLGLWTAGLGLIGFGFELPGLQQNFEQRQQSKLKTLGYLCARVL